jgi:uncharacterized protein YndB with AHSA1/START domain
MPASSTDRIVKTIEIKASPTRVWRAITDYNEFGEWFRVALDGPFAPGQKARGRSLYPGYEHLVFEIQVEAMQSERLFSFRWHPYAVDPKQDYSSEIPTLVEFRLEKIQSGTRLTVTESGFDAIPAARRDEAFRMNSGGWAEQVRNVDSYVNNHP